MDWSWYFFFDFHLVFWGFSFWPLSLNVFFIEYSFYEVYALTNNIIDEWHEWNIAIIISLAI
jgi:hypothetical protein